MIKSLAISCLLAIAAVSTATAGTSAKSSKAVTMPPPAVACPGGIAYSTVEADWIHTWIDDAGEVDGANLELSYSPINHFYVIGTASVISDSGNDVYGYTAGAGFYQPIANNIDFVVEAGAIFDDAENAFYAYPSLRAKFGCLELHAGAKLYCFDEQQWVGFASAYYEVCSNVDVGVSGLFANEATTLQVGLRYKF